MSERVTVAQTAKELGLSPQGMRVQMQRGLLPIGVVVLSVSKAGKPPQNTPIWSENGMKLHMQRQHGIKRKLYLKY